MAQVVVQINGRNYTMHCEDGQENHLRSLAAMVDSEIANITRSVGQLGDLRLLIMAALVIADRLTQEEKTASELKEQIAALRAARNLAENQALAMDEAAAKTLDAASQRLERLVEVAGTYLDAPPAEADEGETPTREAKGGSE